MAEAQPAPDPPPDVNGLVAAIQARHSGLDEQALDAVRRGVAQSRQMAAAMQAHPLQNSDEPQTVLRVARGD